MHVCTFTTSQHQDSTWTAISGPCYGLASALHDLQKKPDLLCCICTCTLKGTTYMQNAEPYQGIVSTRTPFGYPNCLRLERLLILQHYKHQH